MREKLLSQVAITLSFLVLFSLSACSQQSGEQAAVEEMAVAPSTQGINWMSMEEALQAQQQNPKPIFVDIYTDWCGWCKVMDKKTFSQKEVADYLNEHFYTVKFNAEKEGPVDFNGKQYELINAGKRGIHTLAYAMLDGKLSYPAYVILGESLERLAVIKGYKEAEPFLNMLENYQS